MIIYMAIVLTLSLILILIGLWMSLTYDISPCYTSKKEKIGLFLIVSGVVILLFGFIFAAVIKTERREVINSNINAYNISVREQIS